MMRRLAGAALIALVAGTAAYAQSGDTPMLPGRASSSPTGEPGPEYAVHFIYDAFCGQTYAEVPVPPEMKDSHIKDIGKSLGNKPLDILNAMVAMIVTVDEKGNVVEAVAATNWPGSSPFKNVFEDVVTEHWEFVPGKPGKFCATIGIDRDGDGEVSSLFKEPKRAAPKPSVATEIPYPELAYEQNVEGSAVLAIDIDRDSKVTEVRVIDEDPEGYAFGVSAAETVKGEWRFDGATAGRYRLKLKFAR